MAQEPAFFVLRGAFIERVDRPMPGLFAFSLGDGRTRAVLLVAAGPPRSATAVEIVRERPRGEPADGLVRGLREKLEGTRIVRAWRTRRSFGFEAVRGRDEDRVAWWVEASTRGLSCSVPIEGTLPEGEDIGGLPFATKATLVADQTTALAEGARASAIASFRKLATKLARRAAAIETDLAKLREAEARAAEASRFVAAAARAKTGTKTLVTEDWSTGERRIATFEIDPFRPPREQIEAVFARAKRLRQGARIAEERRTEAVRAGDLLADAIERLARANAPEVERIVAHVAKQLPGDVRAPKPAPATGRKTAAAKALPFRRFTSAGGLAILVGKNAAQNDALTMRHARPGDLFLHVKAAPGAHVVVPGWSRQENLDPETLLDAATLAAHFSDQRGEAVVDVAYADRRHVRKRRGAPAGLVEIAQEKVIAVRVEAPRLKRLLASEDR